MKVTLNWLRELVAVELSTAEIAERFTAAGLEVEGIEERGRELDGVVVGEIARVDPHPQAERLVVCQVRTGPGSVRPIVCGARNMRAGDRVALATAGTTLPDGRRIESTEIRGLRSEGMLCAAAELQLGESGDGIMILGANAEVGRPLADVLGIADTVIDVSVTPNRGDCLSVLGLARELAALTGAKLLRQRPALREKGAPAASLVSVRIENPELCGRYAARVVTDVSVAPSPPWMQHRLLAVGLRPINNVVDVTNYVMIERGQPLHAFDLDRLPHPEIVVRRAGGRGEFVTLDGGIARLEPDDLLITTGTDPVAIAGIMGGEHSGVSPQTHRVLLESAWFDPVAVRRTSRRLGLTTESAYRFERNVDIEGTVSALDRAASLLVRVASGTIAPGAIDVYPRPYQAAPVQLRVHRVHELLGVEIDRARITASLKALGATVSAGPHGALSVVPPSHRTDLAREVDIVEEVARVVGYDQIPTTLPVTRLMSGDEGPARPLLRELRLLLGAQGWSEAVPLSFASPRANEIFAGLNQPPNAAPVTLRNPPSQEQSQMRASVLSGLVDCLRHNLNQGERSVALYCTGNVFCAADGAYAQGLRLGGLLYGSCSREGIGAGAAADFYDVKGVVETIVCQFGVEASWVRGEGRSHLHPGLSAALRGAATVLGDAGGVHPSLLGELGVSGPVWVFELDLDILLQYPRRRLFRELARYPAVVRDLAIVTDEDFVADTVIRFVGERGHEWIEGVRLFDQYTGAPIPDGKKSLAFSITYRAADRTLTDEEVNTLHEDLTKSLAGKLGVALRR